MPYLFLIIQVFLYVAAIQISEVQTAVVPDGSQVLIFFYDEKSLKICRFCDIHFHVEYEKM